MLIDQCEMAAWTRVAMLQMLSCSSNEDNTSALLQKQLQRLPALGEFPVLRHPDKASCAQGMNLDPNMMNMMKDLDSSEMNKQLETLGLSPSEVINKIMAEPDLAAAFQKPKVMQAIMESQSNPLAIMNYQDDPDVMLVRSNTNR